MSSAAAAAGRAGTAGGTRAPTSRASSKSASAGTRRIADETIDLGSLRRLIDFLIGEGVHGIWVLGTTGEFASFSRRERAEAVEAAVGAVNGRVPVVVNISDAATRLAVEHARDARDAGA